MNQFWKYRKYLLYAIFIGFVVYFPILSNGFVGDDHIFIIDNPQVHSFNLSFIFGPNLFNTGLFYRPIPALYFSLLYSIIGNHAFLYHFLQLGLHCLCAYLVFLIFRLFFSEALAVLLALVFLIHPQNVESVANIASSTSELSLLFVAIAFLLATKPRLSLWRLIHIQGILLLGLLSKESAFITIPAFLIYRYLWNLGKLRALILASLCTIALYALLRITIGGVTGLGSGDKFSWVPIAQLNFGDRLLNIPAIIMNYLGTFVFPWKLLVDQYWTVRSVESMHFLLSLVTLLLFFGFLLIYGYLLYQRKAKEKPSSIDFYTLVFFSIWLVFSLLPLLQLIPLDMTVADRWFYLGMVGALGITGVLLKQVVKTQHSWKYSRFILFVTACILITFLSVRSFIRTIDWRSDIVLYTHDLAEDPNNYMLLDQMATEYMNVNEWEKALPYEKKSTAISQQMLNEGHLGVIYKNLRDYPNAIKAYTNSLNRGTQLDKTIGLSSRDMPFFEQCYVDLASIYYELGQLQKAKTTITQAHLITQTPSNSASTSNPSTERSSYRFVNKSMNIAFNYPKFLHVQQVTPDIVVLEESTNSSDDDKYFIYSTAKQDLTKRKLELPFRITGTFQGQTPLQVPGFRAYMLWYTDTLYDTHLLEMQQGSQFIAIRFPLKKSLDGNIKQTMETLLESIKVLQE